MMEMRESKHMFLPSWHNWMKVFGIWFPASKALGSIEEWKMVLLFLILLLLVWLWWCRILPLHMLGFLSWDWIVRHTFFVFLPCSSFVWKSRNWQRCWNGFLVLFQAIHFFCSFLEPNNKLWRLCIGHCRPLLFMVSGAFHNVLLNAMDSLADRIPAKQGYLYLRDVGPRFLWIRKIQVFTG